MATPRLLKVLSSVREEVPPQVSFLKALEKTIELANTNDYIPTQCYKPSSMKCIRMRYYQIIGLKPDPVSRDSSLIGIGESGTARHDTIQNYIKRMKEFGFNWEYLDVEEYVKQHNLTHLKVISKKGNETKLHDTRYNIRFLCDGIISNGKETYIFEYKTETTMKARTREEVNEDHYNQATSYSLSFGIDKVIFVYENRDTCEKKPFLFIVDSTMRETLVATIQECDNYVNSNILPPKSTNKRLCYYCDYKNSCSKNINQPIRVVEGENNGS